MPASRKAILGSMLSATPTLLEPMLGMEVKCPTDMIGAVGGVIASKRGKMNKVDQKEIFAVISADIPASETFDISESMRGATAGKAIWSTHFKAWSAVPNSLLPGIIKDLRKRKGLSENHPTAEEFIDKE